MPGRAHAGDAGLDLVAVEGAELAPGARAAVATGLAVAVPEGHAGLVVPRSGRALREGLTVANAPGLIDSGYRGELKVILVNLGRRGRQHRSGRPRRTARRRPRRLRGPRCRGGASAGRRAGGGRVRVLGPLRGSAAELPRDPRRHDGPRARSGPPAARARRLRRHAVGPTRGSCRQARGSWAAGDRGRYVPITWPETAPSRPVSPLLPWPLTTRPSGAASPRRYVRPAWFSYPTTVSISPSSSASTTRSPTSRSSPATVSTGSSPSPGRRWPPEPV